MSKADLSMEVRKKLREVIDATKDMSLAGVPNLEELNAALDSLLAYAEVAKVARYEAVRALAIEATVDEQALEYTANALSRVWGKDPEVLRLALQLAAQVQINEVAPRAA